MKNAARDIIARSLPTFAHRTNRIPNQHDLNDAADEIIRALYHHGYSITRQSECLRPDEE